MSEIRALIVDDSSVMRKIVERALRQAGLDPLVVHEAGSGTEGLEVLKDQPVDLILSDINMPVDGWAGVSAPDSRAESGSRRSGGDDHHRVERGACEAGHSGRSAGIHPQAVYGRAGEGTGVAAGACGLTGRTAVLLNGVRKAAIATARAGGEKEMESYDGGIVA